MTYQSTLAANIFSGQTIIITGGGSGIGRCTAHEMASLGAKVILVGRTQTKLDNVAAEISQDNDLVDTYALDIRDEDEVRACISRLIAKHGVIHGLVNNAGGQFPAKMENISKKGFEAVVANNLTGGFLISREVFRQSMKANGGAIVNITADNLNGMPNMGHSGAARAGVENLTKTQAWEWGQYGVRVNAVAPGWVNSSGFDTYDESMKAMILSLKNHVPLKRVATEAEISSVLSFLISRAANYISGQTIRVDGASSLGSSSVVCPLPSSAATNSESFNGFHRSELPNVLKNNNK
ncbi:SDR family oxidoreductase [Thalassotalea psychrophila]|uniref:Peroxisomal trans-2-enoyl-CoA reductase n=1 Tax=Thalassotalea psychrophila TaxID=3065647 RepID=A0ABY9TZE4_9GAMM|nr:SDR family oxidoreductase [Colwelliaceae bacterium SQ149]